MNMNAVNIFMIGLGGLLIYGAIKDQTIKDIITNATGNKAAAPSSPGNPHPGSGGAGAPHFQAFQPTI
jgi:hypothetical protein